MKKNIVRAILFSALFIFVLCIYNNIFRFKLPDGNVQINQIYMEKTPSDVVFLGSSVSMVGVSPGALWKDNGIASFNASASGDTLWGSYAYLNELLKTQKPKVVVLEVYGVYIDMMTDVGRYTMHYQDIQFSPDKIDYVNEGVLQKYRTDVLLGWPIYHSRYYELTQDDYSYLFSRKGDDLKGGRLRDTAAEQVKGTIASDECPPIPAKQLEYLDKIIALSQANGAKVLLAKFPYAGDNDGNLLYNSIEKYSKEKGVDYVDFNKISDQFNLDYKTDFKDIVHMNYKGTEKFSNYIGQYLVSKYNLPNRKGDPAYQSWDLAQQAYENAVNCYLLEQDTDIISYLKHVEASNLICIVATNKIRDDAGTNQAFEKELKNLGLQSGWNSIQGQCFAGISQNSKRIAEVCSKTEGKIRINLNGDDWLVDTNTNLNSAVVTGVTIGAARSLFKPDNTINILIYDPCSKQIVDTVHFSQVDDSLTR